MWIRGSIPFAEFTYDPKTEQMWKLKKVESFFVLFDSVFPPTDGFEMLPFLLLLLLLLLLLINHALGVFGSHGADS